MIAHAGRRIPAPEPAVAETRPALQKSERVIGGAADADALREYDCHDGQPPRRPPSGGRRRLPGAGLDFPRERLEGLTPARPLPQEWDQEPGPQRENQSDVEGP